MKNLMIENFDGSHDKANMMFPTNQRIYGLCFNAHCCHCSLFYCSRDSNVIVLTSKVTLPGSILSTRQAIGFPVRESDVTSNSTESKITNKLGGCDAP